jgi:hypothetical protein
MAYIDAEDVKAIRNELKEAFPKFKFGVRKQHGSHSVMVTVKQGPTDFSNILKQYGYTNINPYHTGMYGQHSKFFDKVIEVIKTAPAAGNGYNSGRGWYDNSDARVDYFDTAYYMSINVGDWNKPYTQVK